MTNTRARRRALVVAGVGQLADALGVI